MSISFSPRPWLTIDYFDGRPSRYSISVEDVPRTEIHTTSSGVHRIRIIGSGKLYAIEGTPEDDIAQAAELIAVALEHMKYDHIEKAKTDKRDKRRDALAEKFAAPGIPYSSLVVSGQRAIDYIIDLEEGHP